MSSKCDVLEDELYSSRLLLESQNTKMVEQLKGDIDEKFSTITSLRSQLQSEKSNNTKEMIALKEQFQKEKDEMQALYDKKAVENKEHLEKLNEEHENLLQNLNQLQNDASIESSAHQEKLQALEQKLCEVQEIHRVEMDQKMHEIEELQGELKLQAEQNQMALQAVRDDQTDLEVKLSDSKSLVIEKEQIVRSTTAEVQRLTSLLEESKSQLSILTLESSDMEEMSKLFEKRVESSQNEIDALKKELSVCKEQLQANEDHRVLSQNSYITLEAELKVSKESCIDLEEANARLMKEIEILSSSHESQLDEKAEIKEVVVNLEKEKEALKEEMMQAHSQSERYRRELEEVKTQFTMSHKEQIENLQDQITSLRRNRDGLEVQKQAVTAANECHQEMIEGLKNEAEEYRKSITLLTREIDTAKELNEKLTNSVDLLEKITLSHETTIKEKGVLVSSLEEKCRQHEEEYRTAMDRVYGLEQTCEDLSMKLKGASDMLADNENCYSRVKDVMKEEKERLEEKLKDSKEEFDEMKNRLLDAEAALEEKDASMQSYQHEISVLYSSKKNFEARLAENEEVIEQYAMQVQALKVENETMKGDDEIVKTMQVALELNSKTVESLTEELDEKNAMVEEMKQHCRNLEKAAEVTASRIGDLDEKNLRAQAELENLLRLKDESLQDTRKELIEMRDAYRALLTDQSSQKDQDAKGKFISSYLLLPHYYDSKYTIAGLTGLVDTLKELTEENKVKSIELATLQSSFNDQTSELREYKDRYTEYKALGEQLTVEIEQVSSQNASLKKDLSEKKSFFEAEKNQFESIVVAKSVEIDRLNEDSKSQASLCNTLKEEKMKVEAFLQSVKDERDKVLKEYMDYKKEIAENKSNTDTSMAIRLQELHTELSTLESSYSEEVLTFKSSNSKMQAELDSARNNAASLETSLVSKSALVKKLELEKNDLIDQMKNMETREKELSTLVVTLTTETGQLQGQTVELREQNVELQEQLDKAYKRQEDVDTAVKSLDVELRKQLKQVEEERNSLTSQLANASKQLDVHVSTIDLLKADRPALTATVSKLQDEINAGRARMELLSGENKELTVLNDEQRTQLEDLQNKLDTERSANAVFQNVQEEATKNKEEVIILKGTIKELQTQLNMSEQESIELSVELTSLKDQVTTLRAQQDSTKMKMQGDTCALEKIVDENNVLNGTVNELLCSNNDLKVSLSTLEERCCNLEHEKQNLTVELETSKAETKELEEAKNTLDETLLSMQNELMGLSKAMEGLVDMHELEEERKKHEDAMDVVVKEKESAYSELSQSRLDLKQAQDLIFELTNRLESSNVINSSHKRDENDKISTTAAESMKVQQLQKTVAELESKLITRSRAEKQAMHVEKALRDEIDTLTRAQSNSTEKLMEAEKTINQLRLSLSDMKKEDIKYRRVVADLQRAIIAYESQLESSNDEKILDDNTDSSKEDHNGEYEASFKLTAEAEEEKIRSDSEEVEANRLLALQHLYQLQAGIRVSDDYKESWERLYGGLSSPSPFNDDIQLDQLTSQVRHLQSELTSLQATCKKKDDILQRAQSLVTQLKDDNLGKDTLLADVRAELHAKEEEVEFLQTEIASKENTCSQSRQQVLKLSADIDDMNELLTKVQSASKTSTASYESTLEDMTAMCQTLTEERDNLQLAVNESEALQEDMKISIEEFKTSLQSKQRSLDEIEASNAEILSTMNIMSLALSEAQEREGEYAQTTSRLQAEIHELQNKLQEARGSNSEVFLSLEGKLQIATEQLVVAKSRTVHLEEQLSAKNYELSSLRNHYMTFNAETGSTDVSSSNSRTSNELENGDEVLRASLDSMDSVILSEIMDENARITRNCVESMIKRRNVRYKYTSFLALKRCCKDDHDHVDADDSDDELLQGEMFVDQDSCASADIFNISADSIAIDA